MLRRVCREVPNSTLAVEDRADVEKQGVEQTKVCIGRRRRLRVSSLGC